MYYRVVFEIETHADNPLSAAKDIQKTIQSPNTDWQYYVQETKSKEIFSVDLEEEDCNAVKIVNEHVPLIER